MCGEGSCGGCGSGCGGNNSGHGGCGGGCGKCGGKCGGSGKQRRGWEKKEVKYRRDMGPYLAEHFFKSRENFQLSEEEQLKLLNVKKEELLLLEKWKGEGGEYSPSDETLFRLSCLYMIFAGLRGEFADETRRLSWLRSPNHPDLGGMPIEMMLSCEQGLALVASYAQYNMWRP